MVRLAADLLEAELIILEYKEPSIIEKLSTLILKREVVREGEGLLIICASPTDLSLLFQVENFRNRFSCIAAWVIDSFWVDRIPKFIKTSGFYDHIFITSAEDVDEWNRLTKVPTSWLPWASDVLNLGGANKGRKWDLMRVGRQPMEWDDDENTHKKCDEYNINFSGRPKMAQNAIRNHKALIECYRESKFVLAFSNINNPTNYTHPTRAYLTARWVDTLACGGIVAGISPDEASIRKLLWKGATLELDSLKINNGLVEIKRALEKWSPAQVDFNYKESLKRLDWRWRFLEIANLFEISPQILFTDIERLKSEIARISKL